MTKLHWWIQVRKSIICSTLSPLVQLTKIHWWIQVRGSILWSNLSPPLVQVTDWLSSIGGDKSEEVRSVAVFIFKVYHRCWLLHCESWNVKYKSFHFSMKSIARVGALCIIIKIYYLLTFPRLTGRRLAGWHVTEIAENMTRSTFIHETASYTTDPVSLLNRSTCDMCIQKILTNSRSSRWYTSLLPVLTIFILEWSFQETSAHWFTITMTISHLFLFACLQCEVFIPPVIAEAVGASKYSPLDLPSDRSSPLPNVPEYKPNWSFAMPIMDSQHSHRMYVCL